LPIQASSRMPSPMEDILPTSVVPPAPVIARLHELMEVPSVSSSLPNMSNHFPPSVTRDSSRPRALRSSRSPSRSRSTSFNIPTEQSRGIHSDAVNSAEPVPIVVKPPSYGPVSSASTAAMALERAQRERQKAEKEHGRERCRADRGRGVLEKEREAPERDRSRVDIDRARAHQKTTSTSHTPYREHTKVYSSSPVPLDYPSHRIYGSGLGSGAPRDSSTYKHTIKAIPVPHKATV
jgi:hypothetical protein